MSDPILPSRLASDTPEEAEQAMEMYRQDLAQPEGSEERMLAEARLVVVCDNCRDAVVEGITHHCDVSGSTVNVMRTPEPDFDYRDQPHGGSK